MLKIGLIQIRPENAYRSGRAAGIPLGLMSLASYARAARPGKYVFDLRDSYFTTDAEMEDWLCRWRPAVVAISALSIWAKQLSRMVSLVRKSLGTSCHILLGGPHVSSYPSESLSIRGVDAIVTGEGEIPFLDYLEFVEGERCHDRIRGIIHLDHGVPNHHDAAPRLDNLDLLPPPAYDLIDLDRHEFAPNVAATILVPPHRHLALFTSRGCPYGCTFCHNIFGKKFRAQSVDRVIEEIATAALERNVRHFHFYDDIFNAESKRIYALCRGIEQRKLRVKLYFVNGLRADALDRSQLEAMRNAGVVYFGAAIESASKRVQKLLRKHMDVERLLENVEHADDLGIFTNGFFMLGIPGETRAEMEATIQTAEISRLHYAYFNITNPYSGTRMGQSLTEVGRDVSFEQMAGFSSKGKNYAGIDEHDMQRLVRSAYLRFWTVRRLIAFLAVHPDPPSLGFSLAIPGIRRNLMTRMRSVISNKVVQLDDAPWAKPDLPHPYAGRFAQSTSRLLCSMAKQYHRVQNRRFFFQQLSREGK